MPANPQVPTGEMLARGRKDLAQAVTVHNRGWTR